MDNLKNDLETVITAIFDNEEEFLKKFFSTIPSDARIHEFHMSSGGCKLVLTSGFTGYPRTLTVETDDVLEWYQSIAGYSRTKD